MAGTAQSVHNDTVRDSVTRQAVVEINSAITDLETLRAALVGTNLITAPGLAIGTTNTAVQNNAFTFRVNGVGYAKAAVAAGTAPGNDVIPEDKFGAVAFDIGADGTVDAVEATDNATGYATAALAVAGLPAAAAGHVRMGYVTAMKSDGAFTFGTTALNAANTTVAYTDGDLATAAATLIAAQVKDENGNAVTA